MDLIQKAEGYNKKIEPVQKLKKIILKNKIDNLKQKRRTKNF